MVPIKSNINFHNLLNKGNLIPDKASSKSIIDIDDTELTNADAWDNNEAIDAE